MLCAGRGLDPRCRPACDPRCWPARDSLPPVARVVDSGSGAAVSVGTIWGELAGVGVWA